jgi:para-nitrobenzyl esterase
MAKPSLSINDGPAWSMMQVRPQGPQIGSRYMEPVVHTTHGRIRGMAGTKALCFRGVRYGAPTAGSNRFRPPQPPASWQGILDTASPGASAPQLPRPENADPFHAWYSAIQPISEDCLFLDLYTPSLDGKRRPVMFWIHGGGWREFSGTAAGFDGSTLAAAQDVVVITVNHRLNAFGFLAFEGADERFSDAGNAGLMDIVAALQWVRDNAPAFGGDPDNVTLFGESGGGSKIAALLAMPRAKGLFHKAIIQSSAGARRLAAPDESGRVARELATALDRTRLDPVELQGLSMGALLEATRVAPGPYRGMIDGSSLITDPFHDRAPETAAGVPLLIGCTNTELTYWLRCNPANFELAIPDVHRRLGLFFGADESVIDNLIDGYRSAYPAETPTGLLVAIATDHIFKRNNYAIAAMHAASSPVYAYLFEWETPVEGGHVRSPHTIDVPFVFGNLGACSSLVGHGTGLGRLAETTMSAWASFARSGNPANPHMPAWDRYDRQGQKMMIINEESRLEADPGAMTRTALEQFPYFCYQQPMSALTKD